MKYSKAIYTLLLITCYVLFAVSGILVTLSCMFSSTQGNIKLNCNLDLILLLRNASLIKN